MPGSISGRDQVEVKVRVTSPLLDQQSQFSAKPLRRGSFTIVAPARRASSASMTTMAVVAESSQPPAQIADSVEQADEGQVSEQDLPVPASTKGNAVQRMLAAARFRTRC